MDRIRPLKKFFRDRQFLDYNSFRIHLECFQLRNVQVSDALKKKRGKKRIKVKNKNKLDSSKHFLRWRIINFNFSWLTHATLYL